MKNKIFFLALVFSVTATTSFAQRDRSTGGNHDRNYTQTDHRARNQSEDRRHRNPAMSAKAFRSAMQVVNDARFDKDKLQAARFIISRNYLTASQIGTMASLFSFDNTKLAFAQYAYNNCTDPENYHLVTRVFSFSSTRERLFDYLARV